MVDEYKCLSCYLKDKLGTEDIPLMSLDMDFIKNYYNWMLSVRGLAKSTAFERVNTLKWLMYLAMDEGWIHKHPFKKVRVQAGIQETSLSSRRRTCNALSASS